MRASFARPKTRPTVAKMPDH